MLQATVGRWGKNLAVRFPADVAKGAGFGDGERVEVLVQKQEVVIREVAPSPTVMTCFAAKDPRNGASSMPTHTTEELIEAVRSSRNERRCSGRELSQLASIRRVLPADEGSS